MLLVRECFVINLDVRSAAVALGVSWSVGKVKCPLQVSLSGGVKSQPLESGSKFAIK